MQSLLTNSSMGQVSYQSSCRRGLKARESADPRNRRVAEAFALGRHLTGSSEAGSAKFGPLLR